MTPSISFSIKGGELNEKEQQIQEVPQHSCSSNFFIGKRYFVLHRSAVQGPSSLKPPSLILTKTIKNLKGLNS
jgi:hypothetical protein